MTRGRSHSLKTQIACMPRAPAIDVASRRRAHPDSTKKEAAFGAASRVEPHPREGGWMALGEAHSANSRVRCQQKKAAFHKSSDVRKKKPPEGGL